MAKRGANWKGKQGEPSVRPGGKNYLLAIGINDYQNFRPLNNAVRDVETIRDILLQQYQFQPQYTISLLNEDATRENILDTLDNYENTIGPEDNFMLYFAGHGAMNPRGTQGFWIPIEAQQKRSHYISNSRVRDILKDIQAHHIYLLVDSCFSGSMILREVENQNELVETLPSRRVLTSGRKQVVADGPKGGHSPFANCIIQYLRSNSSQNIPALDLEYHVQKNTPSSAEQSPEAAIIFGLGDQSGQFVFHPRLRKQEPVWSDLSSNLDACHQYISEYPTGKHIEETYWEIATLTGKISDYRTYARKYRRGKFITEALETIETFDEGRAFQKAKQQGWTALMRFINQYPDGNYAKEAEKEIESIEAEEEKNESSKTGPFVMIRVEGGTFQMGSNEYESEKPIHEVTLSTFEIGKYPVTQQQWKRIMGNNPSYFKNCPECPVERVSWDDVQIFLENLNAHFPGMNYRLPTEAEWEYAARGGKRSQDFTYAGGNDPGDVGWFDENSSKKTHPVGQKKPNELGIHDMSGNVWEWCQDWYSKGYYQICADQGSVTAPSGPENGQFRVGRGGGWHRETSYLRVTDRSGWLPGYRIFLGFRLARTL